MTSAPPLGIQSLSIEQVSYAYGRTPALQNVSATLRAGELVAIVGPNGCGKSTLLRTLVGEFDPGRWEATQHDVEGRLTRLADARADAAVRLEEARALLARAQGEGPAAVPEPAWLVEPAPPATGSGAPAAGTSAPGAASLFDLPPDSPGTSAPDGKEDDREDDEEVERALATLDARRPEPSVPEPMEGVPVAGEDPATAVSAASTTFDDLAFVRSLGEPSAADSRKTLPCAECGTLNLPTEWYCERCGGELAAE